MLLGAAVFVIGTTNIRACLRRQKPENILRGKVLSAKPVEKRDKEDRLIQHYYEKGEEIELVRDGGKIVPLSGRGITFGMALAISLAGMGLAVFPIVYQNNGERDGSVVLVLLLLLAGAVCFAAFMKDRKKNLMTVEGEITDILYYRRADNKKFSKPVESYYPLIKCRIHDREKTFLSAYNSSTKGTYKAGTKVKLFYDEETKSIVEKKASPFLMVMAVLFWLMALVGLISIFH